MKFYILMTVESWDENVTNFRTVAVTRDLSVAQAWAESRENSYEEVKLVSSVAEAIAL